MAYSNYTPLLSEVLQQLGKIKSKKDKVLYLKENNTNALRQIIKSSFDPKIKWALPYGEVPYVQNEAPEGTEHSVLSYEIRRIYHFIEGGNPTLSQNKRESMFIQMLEGLHPEEADILIAAKDKILHQKYKGLSINVVKEAFDWDDNFMVVEHGTYPASAGSANG